MLTTVQRQQSWKSNTLFTIYATWKNERYNEKHGIWKKLAIKNIVLLYDT